jgi:hypothetical protein
VRNVPTAAWACLTVAFVTVVAAFVYLSAQGADTAEFRSFLNTTLNFAGLLLSGGAVAFAGKAAQQTNGGLDARIEAGVQRALEAQRAADTAPGGELRR